MLELDNKGWAGCVEELIDSSLVHILITVRDTHTGDVIKKWGLKDTVLFKVSENDCIASAKSIINLIDI